MSGRPPKPTQLKVLQGTYRPDRANPGEIFPDAPNDLAPPEWLSERAQAKWNELAPMLASNGLLTECDLDTLALYCVTWVNCSTSLQSVWRFTLRQADLADVGWARGRQRGQSRNAASRSRT